MCCIVALIFINLPTCCSVTLILKNADMMKASSCMTDRAFGETCQVPLLIVFIWMGKGIGPANAISLLKIMWGWKVKSPHG